MLGRNLLVVDDENAQVVDVDSTCSLHPLGIAVSKRDRNYELGAHALFGLDVDGAIHHVHNAFRDGHSQARAAILVFTAAVFLRKRFEQLGNERLIHTDTRVLNGESQGRLPAEHRSAFDGERHASRRVGELDGVAQDVDEDFLELCVVADVIIIYLAQDATFVDKTLVP